MKIETALAGQIQIGRDQIIHFQDGLPGFNDEKEFVIILNEDEENPLHWLQSVATPDLSFVIVNPFEIYDDYDFKLPKTAIEKLKIEDREDLAIYTIVVIPEDVSKMTTNLIGPIIINQKNMEAKQVILEDDRYSTKHFLIKQESLEEDEKGGN